MVKYPLYAPIKVAGNWRSHFVVVCQHDRSSLETVHSRPIYLIPEVEMNWASICQNLAAGLLEKCQRIASQSELLSRNLRQSDTLHVWTFEKLGHDIR